MSLALLQPPSPKQSLREALGGPVRSAAIIIGLFFGVFGAWAAFAPLAGGALALGIVSPEGSRRTIQHLEGGIVQAIYVEDGERVEAGAPLLLLAQTQAQAGFALHQGRRLALLAQIARLRAEQSGAGAIAFPKELNGEAALRTAQMDQLRTRRADQAAQREVLEARIAQLEQEISGYEALVRSRATQAGLLGKELAAVQTLLDQGLATQPRVLALQRARAEAEGARAENVAAIARARQQISEARAQMLALRTGAQSQIAAELERAQVELAGVEQQLHASSDVLARTTITAPVSGRVISKRVTTIGGVVGPGQPILEIVPEEALVIEARVAPIDIDVVREGLSAQVQLTAFSQRALPQIAGVVRSVSADALTDQATGQLYYAARVEVPPGELAKVQARLGEAAALKPGMPAQVLIETGERTLLAYLLEPFTQSFRGALSET